MFFQDLRNSRPLNAGCSIEKHANLPMKCWPNASVTMRNLERCCCVCINGSFHQKILRSFDAFTRNPRRSFNTSTEKHHPRASAAEPKKINSYQEDPKGWAHTDFFIRVRAEIRVLGPRPLLEQSPLLEILGGVQKKSKDTVGCRPDPVTHDVQLQKSFLNRFSVLNIWETF